MAAELDLVAAFLAELEQAPDSDRLACLTNLQDAVGALPPSKQKDLVVSLDAKIELLFDCFNTSNSTQISVTRDILVRLLPHVEPEKLLTRYRKHLQRGLQHPEPRVKELVLKALRRLASDEELAILLCRDSILFPAAISLIGDSNLAVGHCALELFKKLTRYNIAVDTMIDHQAILVLEDLMLTGGDEVRFRIYEVMVRIAERSADMLRLMNQKGILNSLVAKAYSADILVQVTALDLLSDLAQTEHGLNYLESQGLLSKLEAQLRGYTTDPKSGLDPLGAIILPGVLKFFGSVAHWKPAMACQKYLIFAHALFALLEHPDVTIATLAVETIAIIASSPEGKSVMREYVLGMKSCMNCIGHLLQSTPSDNRLKILPSLATLMEVSPQGPGTTPLLETSRMWFYNLAPSSSSDNSGEEAVEILMQGCKQPFSDIRLATLQVLQVLAPQPWAQMVLHSWPGFMAFLLDRTAEPSKETKEAKYEVVKKIFGSPTAVLAFTDEELQMMKEHLEKGPFYKQVQAEVAFERAV